jgi:5-methylcytosine-specific restriction protein A
LVRTPYCDKHLHTNERATKKPDPFYNSPEWRRLQPFLKRKNSICQRKVNGVQCMNPSVICHHLRGIHTAPELKLDPNNLVMLCREHHPDDETPLWKVGADYVPTVADVTL